MIARTSVIWALFAGSCLAATLPSTTDSAKPSVFTFTMKNDERLVVGIDNGTKGVLEYEQGEFSHLAVHVMPDSTEKWSVKVAINTLTTGNQKTCKFAAAWQRDLADGSKLNRIEMRWEEKLPTDKDVQLIKPDEPVNPEAEERNGIQFYRIPFAKVDGETRSLVVCMSKNREAIEKAIKIPKTSLFLWKNSWVDSPGPLGSN